MKEGRKKGRKQGNGRERTEGGEKQPLCGKLIKETGEGKRQGLVRWKPRKRGGGGGREGKEGIMRNGLGEDGWRKRNMGRDR